MNRWNIPSSLEAEITARDQKCVYCGVDFTQPSQSRGSRPSWEHIVNDARIITRENISKCCISCNASKGTKELSAWLESNYCKRKGITVESVSDVIKRALESPPQYQSPNR